MGIKNFWGVLALFSLGAACVLSCGPKPKKVDLEKEFRAEKKPAYYEPLIAPQNHYYGLIPKDAVSQDEEALGNMIRELYLKYDFKAPIWDLRLSIIARELARYSAIKETTPPVAFQRIANMWAGLGEYDTEVTFRKFVGNLDAVKFAETMASQIKETDKRFAPTYFGVGFFEPKGSPTTIVATVSIRRLVEFNPFPKKIKPCETISISGRMLYPGLRAMAFFTLPNRKSQAMKVDVKGDGSFNIQIALPKNLTMFKFELVAETDQARKPVAGFDVYVTEEEPRKFQYPKEYAKGIIAPDEVEKLFVSLLNAERKSRGLNELLVEPNVSRLASNWAQKGGSDVEAARKQMLERGISFFHFRTMAMRGKDTHQLYDNLVNTPSFKIALFDPNFSHIGVGAYVTGDGYNVLISAALLAAPISENRKVLREEYMRRISEFRISNGLLPLRYDGRLQKVLDTAADNIAIGSADVADVREEVKKAIQGLNPPVKIPATTYFNVLSMDAALPAPVAKSMLEARRDSISFAIKPITNPESSFKGYLIYYVVFSR